MPGNAKRAILPGAGIDPAAETQRTVNREGVGKGWQVKIKSNRQDRQARQERQEELFDHMASSYDIAHARETCGSSRLPLRAERRLGRAKLWLPW
jgi:hypothetical protein